MHPPRSTPLGYLASLCICFVFLGIVACKDDTNQAPPDTPSPSPASSGDTEATPGSEAALTAADLEDALLRVEDLAPGWVLDPPEASEDDDGTCGLNLTTDFRITAEVRRQFSVSPFGPFLGEQILLYEAGEADRAWSALTETLSTCSQDVDIDESGVETVYELGPLDLPKIGDGVVARAMQGPTAAVELFGSFQAHLVIIRHGDVFLFLAHATFDTNALDPARTEESARAAFARAEETLR
jgi:hypothetical protein